MVIDAMSEDDFRTNLQEVLTLKLCWEFVGQAIGNVGAFQEYDFFDADEFLTIFIDGRSSKETAENAKKVIMGFRDGVDLDNGSDGADINADYFAWSEYGDYIQSTDDPAKYIYDNALDDIIDYIVDNFEDEPDWFPSEVQEVIDEYNANREEDDEE
jgi:hypothetical protein